MKIVSVVGARPQFIKEAMLSKELRKDHDEVIIHTGQHYDLRLSEVFFEDLGIPHPDYNLGVGSMSHGEQTGEMLIKIEEVLLLERPDMVLVYGDTNSTLAGALAASKLHMQIGHVEAGLRSWDRDMPEETNRVLTDHMADWLFCPSRKAVVNLLAESVKTGVYNTGDVMVDAVKQYLPVALDSSKILHKFSVDPFEYYLATVHRPSNTDSPDNLHQIISAFTKLDKPVIFPVHPRTKAEIREFGLNYPTGNIIFTEPVGYLDMLKLTAHAHKVITDSGGLQKEAFIIGRQCVTLRDTTEWTETLEGNWNVLVGHDKKQIIAEAMNDAKPHDIGKPYGNGKAAKCICRKLVSA